MKPRNPQLLGIPTDDLITELVARQAAAISRMNAAIGLFDAETTERTFTLDEPLPLLPERFKPKKRATPAAAPEQTSGGSIQARVIGAIRALGEPSNPTDICAKMINLGWAPTSAKPYASVYVTLQALAKSKAVVKDKNKLWSVGENADAPRSRKPRTRRSSAPTDISDPGAVIKAMDGEPSPPVEFRTAVPALPPLSPVGPALYAGETLLSSNNGSKVIRRQAEES